ncbi:hypothetical protein B0H11DRAFT_1913061 [Mycena galericulata]|nr:hypothetical protein B0H11DRAFT_1913061 [Mycena galericulata]
MTYSRQVRDELDHCCARDKSRRFEKIIISSSQKCRKLPRRLPTSSDRMAPHLLLLDFQNNLMETDLADSCGDLLCARRSHRAQEIIPWIFAKVSEAPSPPPDELRSYGVVSTNTRLPKQFGGDGSCDDRVGPSSSLALGNFVGLLSNYAAQMAHDSPTMLATYFTSKKQQADLNTPLGLFSGLWPPPSISCTYLRPLQKLSWRACEKASEFKCFRRCNLIKRETATI